MQTVITAEANLTRRKRVPLLPTAATKEIHCVEDNTWYVFFYFLHMQKAIQHIDTTVQDQLPVLPSHHTVNKTLEWLPILSLLVFKLGPGKRVEILHRIKLLGLAEIFVLSVLQASAHLVPRKRPKPWMEHDSFPSGHTAHAFLGAEIMRQRLRQSAPKLAMAGYGVALAMGGLRLLNKKHWLSDVIAGMALGILSAKLAGSLVQAKPSRFRQLIQQVKLIRSGRTMNQSIPGGDN